MIRSEKLINQLIANLHFHNYMTITGDDIMSNNHKVVITNSKKQVILDYIDDVYIDYFFRTHTFRPIIIPKGFVEKRYTEQGTVLVTSDLSLWLNNIYDRCTFVEFIFQNFCLRSNFMEQNFPQNKFLQDLYADDGMNGTVGLYNRILTSNLMGYECSAFLDSGDFTMYKVIDKYMQKDFGLHARASILMKFNNHLNENLYNFNFEGFTSIGIQYMSDIRRDYIKIKDSHIFGDYTIEEILLIYSLLVEKFKLEEGNISTFVPMYVEINSMKSNIIGQFNEYESYNVDCKIIESNMFINDLYLRFTNPQRSKAFTIKIIDDMFMEIQHFKEQPIKFVYRNNPLPLPYLYNHLYNK